MTYMKYDYDSPQFYCYPSCECIRSYGNFLFLLLISFIGTLFCSYGFFNFLVYQKLLLIPFSILFILLFYLSGQTVVFSSAEKQSSMVFFREDFSIFRIREIIIVNKEYEKLYSTYPNCVIVTKIEANLNNYNDSFLFRRYYLGEKLTFTVIRGLGNLFSLPDCKK